MFPSSSARARLQLSIRREAVEVSKDLEACSRSISGERLNLAETRTEQSFDVLNGRIAASEPDEFGWGAEKKAQIVKIRIERHNNEPVLLCMSPDRTVLSCGEAKQERLREPGKTSARRLTDLWLRW